MSKEHPSILNSCIFSVLAVVVFFALVIVLASKIIYVRAEEQFGPSASGLNSREHLMYSALLLWRTKELTNPLDPQGENITFNIEFGESISSITGRLWDHNLITNPGIFRTYLQYSGLDKTIQAGEHTLSQRLTPIEIAQALQDAIPTHVTFVVIPGWRMEEIAASLSTSGLTFSEEDFLSLANVPPSDFAFLTNYPAYATLEGFFYPDTYHLLRELSAREFIHTMVNNFDLQISQEIRQGLERQGLDLYRGTTLASIVEREAVVEGEKPLIASVFLNRLSVSMPLASDPTVQYALGYNQEQMTWWTNPLSLQDLRLDSPYNTYINIDLPPGPIANPVKTSLRAVAFPAQTSYLYFRAMCDQSGRHIFSKTFEEHINNACP
jgi:UPF0755 protein